MSTSTIIRLVRWRIRDWATCFSACALPPVDEEPGTNCSTSTQLAARAVVFDPMGESRSREIDRKKSSRKKYEKEKASAESPNENTASKETEDGSNNRRWPSFAEEEYIVFCFREDGAIHMIKERRSSEASDNQIDHASRNRRSANQKVCNHGDSHAEKKNISANGDTTLLDKLGDEKEDNDVQVVWPPDEIKEVNHIEATDDNMGSAESMDSNLSDASSSTGSFAFPVLGWEWMGSPVQMPKPEGIRLRKNKARAVRLHCCRF